jgi:hypothetical protein
MFMGHDSEPSAVPILEHADVGGIQMLLGYSKLDTTDLLTRVATFPLATKAGEAGVTTWTVNRRRSMTHSMSDGPTVVPIGSGIYVQ